MTPHFRRSPSAQRGFTLVELVVVITILGILAAVALPRFTNLQNQARISKIQALTGAVRAAAAQAKAAALVGNADCTAATGGSVTMEGAAIALAFCYPTRDSIVTAANLDLVTDDVWTDSTTAGTMVISLRRSGAAWADCNVRYVAATAPNGQPTVTNTITGC